jgi:DNA primase
VSSIPRDFINQLLAQIDIVSLIQSYLPLRKKGSNYVACCPFHEEVTPSFTVSPQKQFYHCFGCGVGGNVISFVMQHERLSFVEAVESLAQYCQVSVPKDSHARERIMPMDDMYGLMERALHFYQAQLSQSPSALNYLENRGFSKKVIQQFCLGFAPSSWDSLFKTLTQSGQYSAPLLKTAGLIIQKASNQYYDRFRDRIVFPIRDRRGRCVGFGGRVISPHQEPKYLNSPETPIFHKSNELYGLYEACQSCKSFERIWVVEGYIDVLSLHQFGIPQVVATLGTAISRAHLQQLFRLTEEVVFCFDGDAAGRKAALRALELSLSALQDGWHIRFLLLPEGEDPDSWVRRSSPNHTPLNQLLEKSLSLSQFLFQHLQRGLDLNSAEGKSKLAQRALPLFKKVPKNIMREQLYERLTHVVNLSRDQLDRLGNLNRDNQLKVMSKKKTYSLEERAIGLVLQYPQQLVSLVSPEMKRKLNADYPHFVQLVELAQSIPGSNTAILLETFRQQETHYAKLLMLARHDWLVPASGVVEEFRDILSRLEISLNERVIEQLIGKARQQTLTIQEKQKLSRLLKNRHKAIN